MCSMEKGTQMSTNCMQYLEELGALLEEYFEEEVYTSALVADDRPENIILRGSLYELFFAVKYDPKVPVEVLAYDIIQKIEKERERAD